MKKKSRKNFRDGVATTFSPPLPPPPRSPVRLRVNLMYFMFHIVGILGLNPVLTFLLAEWLMSA